MRDLNKPMGVASLGAVSKVRPCKLDALRDSLPSAEQLQAELERIETELDE